MKTQTKSSENISKRVSKKKISFAKLWKYLKVKGKIYLVFIHLFALVGFAIIGAWAFYEMGFTKNRGGVDKNNRYLSNNTYNEMYRDTFYGRGEILSDYLSIAVLRNFYPKNADLIFKAAQCSDRPTAVKEMLFAAEMYMKDDPKSNSYYSLLDNINRNFKTQNTSNNDKNLISWMNDTAWLALKGAILRDTAVIEEAARLTGVEPRMIVACLVGEQVRLFNSKREMFKRYLGPMKVLSVQSQFSLGVNGIKDFTAMKVEQNLIDTASIFYMGKKYEHILDFHTDDITNERINRLTNYSNHLYSYIYTGCILHQTMLQWRRSGYEIQNRPDILFTLFNLGFAASKPGPNPQCGGSHINVGDEVYTFGVICNDFYYSGELAEYFPLKAQRFVE